MRPRSCPVGSLVLLAAVGLGCAPDPADDASSSAGTTLPIDADTDPLASSTGVTTSGTDAAGDTTLADPTAEPASTTDDTGPPASECTVASLFGPGVHTGIVVDVDGVPRSYDLFVPTTYDPTAAAPLVVNFHGLFGSPGQQADFSQFNLTAEERGMLVAYPEGLGQSFNAGACCGEASSSGVDDVGFARALVADVTLKMCVDDRRVYATGMSNGGHMAHRLACEASDLFAATGSVAGVLALVGPCVPSRPISIVQFHGTADTIVSYDGFPNVPNMMAAWAARNGCQAAAQVTFDQGDTRCETWPGCDAGVEVTLCTIEGGGHCWPGNPACLFGRSTTVLHASEVLAAMFEAQPLP